MRPGSLQGVGSALAWFAFPIVPALLGSTYRQELYWGVRDEGRARPARLGLGDLVPHDRPAPGIRLPGGIDDQPARRPAPSRGPRLAVSSIALGGRRPLGRIPGLGGDHPGDPVRGLGASRELGMVRTLAAGQLAGHLDGLADFSCRRDRPAGLWMAVRGLGGDPSGGSAGTAPPVDRPRLAVAVGFVGSLFGSFWTITEVWRGYFFDPRIAPGLLAIASLALVTGCGATETLGEVRRRELFQAMLMAWLLGLALAWRWWSRSRSKPPGPPS